MDGQQGQEWGLSVEVHESSSPVGSHADLPLDSANQLLQQIKSSIYTQHMYSAHVHY